MNFSKKPDPAARTAASPDLATILAQSGGSRKRSRRFLWPVLALLVLGGGYAAYSSYEGSGPRIAYTTEAIARGSLSVVVTATGSVQPTDQVDVSSELSGTVRRVNVSYNSAVKAGDVLLELDSNKQEADVQSARAQLASAQANVLKAEAELASAKVTLDRLTGLVGNRIASQQDLDSARYAYRSAEATRSVNQAAVLSAQASLRLAEVNLSKLKVLSPIDGIVLTRDVDPGATVASSLNAPVLFTIAGDLRQMELQVSVDEADVGQVRDGMDASFSVDAYPNRKFPAKIEAVRFASETVNNVVTYKAILTVDNAELLLRPGMTATADITVESLRDTLLVPNTALRYSPPRQSDMRGGNPLTRLFSPPRRPRSGGGRNEATASDGTRVVWVLRDGRPQRARIVTGATDGRFTAVTSGELSVGDLVITDAANQNG